MTHPGSYAVQISLEHPRRRVSPVGSRPMDRMDPADLGERQHSEPIEDGGGQRGIAEVTAPVAERDVGGHGGRGATVSSRRARRFMAPNRMPEFRMAFHSSCAIREAAVARVAVQLRQLEEVLIPGASSAWPEQLLLDEPPDPPRFTDAAGDIDGTRLTPPAATVIVSSSVGENAASTS